VGVIVLSRAANIAASYCAMQYCLASLYA
jgi:hypothetical protein